MNLLSVHEASHCIAANHFVGARLGFIHRDGDGGFLVRNDIEHKKISKREMVGMMAGGILGEQIFAWALSKRTQQLRNDNVGALMWNLYLAIGAEKFMKTPHGESDAAQITEWLAEDFISEEELGEIVGDLGAVLFRGFNGINFSEMSQALKSLQGQDYIELDFSGALVAWEPVTYFDPSCAVA